MPNPQAKDPAFLERYGPWVLVAGASEGTGAEFARLAAAKGANCILVARRIEKLEALAAELRGANGVEVAVVGLDLTAPTAAAELEAAAAGKDLGLVVFNAGGDDIGGNFLNSPYAEWRKLTSRNIDTLTEAAHRFAQILVRRGRGGLLIVGSEAGFGGTGRLALYTATKAYQLAFGESLWIELKRHGVDVLNLLIGATDTPKLRGVLAKHGLSPDDIGLTLPAEVARQGLANLGNGPTLCLTPEGADDQPLGSQRIRRGRVERQSQYLDNFYGPQ